jgi:hypothetical protein
MQYLEPRSPCCFELLIAKIGSRKYVCEKCQNEFLIIEEWRIESELNRIRQNMQKAKLQSEKQYWIGFIGGMRYSKQLGDKKL